MAWNDKVEDGEVKDKKVYYFEGEAYDIHTMSDGSRGIYYLVPSKDGMSFYGEFYTIQRLNRAVRKNKKEVEGEIKDVRTRRAKKTKRSK